MNGVCNTSMSCQRKLASSALGRQEKMLDASRSLPRHVSSRGWHDMNADMARFFRGERECLII